MLPRGNRPLGQALVEFALILVLLLLFIFIIVESGRLLQGWLTVQNAARVAGRYAITGQFDPSCLAVFPACLDPRVASIKQEAFSAAAGLVIDPSKLVGQPQSFVTEVWAQDETDTWKPDYAGASGKPVRIKVSYFMPVITPLFRPIAAAVRLNGQVVVNNEDFDQVSNSQPAVNPPNVSVGTNELPKADLEISKSASSTTVVAGTSFNYTLDVHNNGPFDAENIVVADTLPAWFQVTGTSVIPNGNCTTSGALASGLTATCLPPNLAGDGGPASNTQVLIDVFVDPDVRGDQVNTAAVQSGPVTIEPDLSNNSSSETVTVIGEADLELVFKTDTPDPVRIDSVLLYNLRVRNNGPSSANGVVLVDTLPQQVLFTSAVSSQGLCTRSGQVVTCTIGMLPVGKIVDVAVQVVAGDFLGSITNQASVSGTETDPVPGNNAKSENTQIVLP